MSDATARRSPRRIMVGPAPELLPNFAFERALFETQRLGIYRAHRLDDKGRPSEPVLIKVLRDQNPSPTELSRMDAERAMFRSLRVRGVPRLVAAGDFQTASPAIVLAAADGDPLDAVIHEQPFQVGSFLTVALEMAAIVGRLHSAGVTHTNLQPSAFLWNEAAGRLTLIDLSRATRLQRERPAIPGTDRTDETPAYISPEQTGRMNRDLDHRTDLYSLGVTFFQMLTGRLPFESPDPLEIVHSHIARRPPRVETLTPEVPAALGDIVARLLEKSAEDRYQSAQGLLADLELCRRQLAESGRIQPFALAQRDHASLPMLAAELYGRELEVEALLASFDRAAAGGAELVVVTGHSGVGKTALVREVHKPIAARGGNFVEGKYDRQHRNTPYAAWIVAFTGLVHYLLIGSDSELEFWRRRIAEALGANGKVVTDVIPDLRLVIGPQPAVPDLAPKELDNRFQLVLGDFVRAVATADHPLAVFLDDLQWADPASLKLLESLLSDQSLAHLLIVGACRSSDLDTGHPLRESLRRIDAGGRKHTALRVRPLRVADVARLLADALHCSVEHASELARLVHAKTDAHEPWHAVEAREPDMGPLDLKSVTKASQTISREIELDRLLARLLQIAIENAGAERGVLLLHHGDRLVVEAEASSDNLTAILSSTPLADRADIAQSVVLFVARSGESVLLDDASKEGAFVADPSIAARATRSVLCLPIALQGMPLGVVYLENNLAAHAFSANQLEALEILCSQAAISLENARLYAERDRTLEALRESEEKYRALVENTADVVFSVDTEGVFTYVSPAMEVLAGYTVDEIVGTLFSKLVLPADVGRATAAFERAVNGDVAPVEFRGIRKDESVLSLRVSARPTLEAGRIVGFTGILTDISERRALEEQLLGAMKMESIGRLAGGVAHDFNNLLTAILGNAELALLDLPEDSPAREAIGEITKAGNRASSLTRQLLAFASKQIIAPVHLNLSSVVRDSERMLNRLLGENIEITTVVDPHLALIEADPGQMEQLLVNLTINARDAMPSGGRLVIETRNAFVEASPRRSVTEVAPGRWVVLTVTDTGNGMEREVLDHIFEPFFTTKEAGKGTGLGLATCHGIVKQNRGHIFVFSEPGLGSTFRIMLPVAKTGATAAAESQAPPAAIDGTETVLVVEDEPMVRRLAVIGLRAHGYTVIEAPDGQTALTIAADSETRIDLVVSDVVMPGMSGPDLGRRLAELRPEAALILASGHAEAVVLAEHTSRGGARFLQKPFTPELLARKVREVLDAPRPPAGDSD